MASDEALMPLMNSDDKSMQSTGGTSQEKLFPRPKQKMFRIGKYSYPVSIFFIVGNEFCERFSYYGMKTILVVYFTKYLMMDERTSTAVYHAFTMLCYFTPLLGAAMADGWLGRYRTILYVSAMYAAGNAMMSLTAMPPPERAGPFIALFLIALCTGGIKPCVSAFGGDQFYPGQEKELSTFFSAFYFSINGGSLLSTFITPLLRAEVRCLGYDSCYPLAFGVPALLMLLALGLFFAGRSIYRCVPPAGNTVGMFIMATARAVKNKFKNGSRQPSKEHWLHYAGDKYDMSFLQDMRAVYQVLFLYLPLPFFWALFDQQGSRWTIQASKLDGHVAGSWSIQPDQMQILNPLLILLLIPLFDSAVFPLLNKLKIPNRPLQRMVVGMFFAVLAFLAAGFLEMKIRDVAAGVSANSSAPYTAIFNRAGCPVNVTGFSDRSHVEVKSLQVTPLVEGLQGNLTLNVSGPCVARTTLSLQLKPATISLVSVLATPAGTAVGSRNAAARMVVYGEIPSDSKHDTPLSAAKASLSFVVLDHLFDNSTSFEVRLQQNASGHSYNLSGDAIAKAKLTFHSLEPGSYDVYLMKDGKLVQSLTSLHVKAADTALILLYRTNSSVVVTVQPISDVSAKSQIKTQIPIALQIPQYILISVGEVLFSVTGLSFSYSQAPASMKSVLTAAWLLTVAFGNLIVVAVAEGSSLPQFAEYFLFAGLMFVDMCLFAFMTISYKYVESAESSSTAAAVTDTSDDGETTEAVAAGSSVH